jgi:hypothetical protein
VTAGRGKCCASWVGLEVALRKQKAQLEVWIRTLHPQTQQQEIGKCHHKVAGLGFKPEELRNRD